MMAQPAQKISTLTETDKKRLSDQRAVVEDLIPDEDTRQKFRTAAGKLGMIRAILRDDSFKSSQTHELQCLGIVLGDAFAQELAMEWVVVEEEGARDPALRLPGTTIILFPLTMISKRLERGESVDVFDLFNGIAAKVDEARRHERSETEPR